LYFEGSPQSSKIVALDEAHKFLTATGAGDVFTSSLLRIVREQRHKGARVVISTQEPTISPALLDLCSMTFVHRFSSPAWLALLRKHLVGANDPDLMQEIVGLRVGECIVFAPTAVLHTVDDSFRPSGAQYVHMMIRERVTEDGGRSVMAATE